MTIELVVFDIAGTVVRDDDVVNGCLRAALAAVGVEVCRAAVNGVMGLQKPEALRRLIDPSGRTAELLPRIPAIHDDFVARMIAYYRTDPRFAEVDGAGAVLRRLRAAGMRVGLDTGFGRTITDAVLERLGWREGETIDASVTSDEVTHGRPHPDMIRHLMARLGVADSHRVAKVGDTPADLHEGTNAGCGMVIGITSGTHTRAELEPHPHTHLIESVRDVPALLHLDGAQIADR
jgi:phosphonatase-like hydrolase